VRDDPHGFGYLRREASRADGGEDAKQARTLLERLVPSGPPLARLAAQVGRAFLGATRRHARLLRQAVRRLASCPNSGGRRMSEGALNLMNHGSKTPFASAMRQRVA
jgi:hypothetical protein